MAETAAMVTPLNRIYEEDFLGFSYGFQPGRSQHDALDVLAVGIGATRVNWILDADIRSYFDKIDPQWLIRFLEHRIGDERVIRLVRKSMATARSHRQCHFRALRRRYRCRL